MILMINSSTFHKTSDTSAGSLPTKRTRKGYK
jgi:hypothetical protein